MFELQPVRYEIEIKGFHGIYYFEFSKNFSHTPEKHEFWEMVYVDNGKIVATSDGIAKTLSQGQVIFHEPGELHSHVSDNISGNNMLVIAFSADPEAMKFFSKKTFTLNKTTKILLSLFLDEVQDAMVNIPNSYDDKNNLDFSHARFGSTQLLQGYLSEFLIRLIRGGEGRKINADEQLRITSSVPATQIIKDYLAENLYSEMSIQVLCDHFKIGKSQLIKNFKDSSSKSPMDYFHSLRIAEAKNLLRDGKHSISEISDMFKYSNVHNFSRAFKKATGFSPMAYIKSIK